jgi:lysophospholipase L1-like esterase
MRAFYFALVLLVIPFTAFHAAADEVVWPLPPVPAGTPAAQFAAPQADTNFFNHIREARSQQTDLILDGDSITDYWQSTGRTVFDKYFAPRHAIDFGMSGNHTESVLWRVEHGQLDTLHPKLAMILIGVNNSGSPTEEVVAGITRVVQAYRAKCPDMHILLLAIFPHGKLSTDPMRENARKTNAQIAKLDDGAHVTFLDIGDKFLQPDGSIAEDVMPDALHPGLKGYQIWADAVESTVEKYCPMPKPGAPVATVAAPSIEEVAASVPPQKWPYAIYPPPGTFSTVFPDYYIGWFRNFQRNLDLLKQGPYDLIFDGDSLAADWEGHGRAILQARYGNIKRLNLGAYADRVENVLWRVRHGSLDGQNPKLIVLLTGLAHFGEDVKDVTGGVKLILDEYKKRCPGAHIVLVGVLPNREDAQTRPWIGQLNACYAGLADDRVTYLDVGAKFRQPDGSLQYDNLMPNHFDVSEKGYTIWADAMQPLVDKYLPGAAGK